MNWKTPTVLLIGLLLLGGVVTAVPFDKPEAVPLATVKALALRELHKFPEFNGAVPTNPTPLYFPDGRLAAYEFRMVKNGKTVGYIIVSANRNLPPAILEAGFGKKTPSDMMKELAARKGVKTYRLAYFSGLNYGILAGDKVVDMKGREYRKPEKYVLQTGAYASSWDTAGQYTIQAATLIDQKMLWNVPRWTESDPSGGSWAGYDYIGPNADPWDKWDGCAPIAASMIIGYYETQYQTDWYKEAVIDILHYLMGTSDSGWTSTSNIGPGIEGFYDRALQLPGILRIGINYQLSQLTGFPVPVLFP